MTYSQKKNNSPRIVMILTNLPPMQMGGAEMQAMKLCRQLLVMGFDVKVITWGKIWHPKKGEYNGVPYTRLRSLINLVSDLPSLLKKKKSSSPTKIDYDDKLEVTTEMNSKVWSGMILRYRLVYLNCLQYLYFKRSSFDILHVHMMEWPSFVAVRLGKKLGKQVLVKDSTMNGIFNLLRYPDGLQKQKEVADYAYFVAMTKMIRNNLLKGSVPEQKITMIPNGIEIFAPSSTTKTWSQKVIFVGNLTQQPAKGIDILMLAWQEVINDFPDVTLQIVGEGDLEAYEKHAETLSIHHAVSFPGKQRNIGQLLMNADIFVLPSRREGMSNALMEAMVRAMPVVVTDVSGNQDLVEHGISGLIVPPANATELASAIKQMLRDPEKAIQMGKNAYRSVSEKCDIKKVAAEYGALYNKILSQTQ
jgi:glycosyltransferase involved in cell wall biosynthesis